MDLITIAIPVYNAGKYLEIALLSALNQTYKNIEFLIVYDKSTDNSLEIIKTILDTHPRKESVRIIEGPVNIGGIGGARNAAIEEAKGKYFFFMDADDEITPDCIDVLYKSMSEEPVDFVNASIETKDRNGNTIEQLIYKNKHFTSSKEIVCDYYMHKKRSSTVWNKLYDLSFLRRNNILCLHSYMHEDNLFIFQLILNACSCNYISDITYYYYDTPDSLNKESDNNRVSEKYALQYIDSIDFKRKYIQNYSDVKIRESVLRFIIFQTIYYAVLIKNSIILNDTEKKLYLKQLIIFPFKVSESIKFQKTLFFYIMYIIYAMPFASTCFRFIRYLSSKK